MVDRCVMCGDIIPEGSQICKRCENNDSCAYTMCPSCGSPLERMSYHWYNTGRGHAKNTVFHCNTCYLDWEKDEEYIAQPVKFTRKIWG